MVKAQPVLSAARDRSDGYCWQPRALNVWVGRPPQNPLQAYLLQELRERLEAVGCIFVEDAAQPTPLGPVAHLGMIFGRDLDEEIDPFATLGQMPKPRGSVLVINTVESLPDVPLFDLARGQLVKLAGHFGILVEGHLESTDIRRGLWASMAGNNRLLGGSAEAILDSLALRILAHAGAEKINDHDADEPMGLTWEAWSASPVHADIAEASRALGAAGVIEDEVPLGSYGTGEQVGSILRFLNRAALGEGMRSQLDPALRIMAVTTSGGSKINVSADPRDGHLVPIRQISRFGYVRAVPQGCPISFNAPSVETHENGMIYLAGALVNAGRLDSFDSFLAYLDDHFARHDRIDILPEGLTPKFTALEHFHRQPRDGSIREPQRVEIVTPDVARFPPIDFPCGVREAELALLSALFQAPSFHTPGRLGDRMILAVLPGHGSVALYDGPREELTTLLLNGMALEEIVRV